MNSATQPLSEGQAASMADVIRGLSGSAWNRYCRDRHPDKSQVLPAGVTYLAQLLAHDLFLTESRPCDVCPFFRGGVCEQQSFDRAADAEHTLWSDRRRRARFV